MLNASESVHYRTVEITGKLGIIQLYKQIAQKV